MFDQDLYFDDPQPVCTAHLAWVPCRHGRPDSPCHLSSDLTDRTIVSDYHSGSLSREQALARLEATPRPGE